MAAVLLHITFGKTNSPNYRRAIRRAKKLPGYREEGEGRDVEHTIETDVPVEDDGHWYEIGKLWELIGRWRGSEGRAGARPLKEGLQLQACYRNRAAHGIGDRYCRGCHHPTAEPTNLGCRLLSGVHLRPFGRAAKESCWYHHGELSDDLLSFVVDKPGIVSRLRTMNAEALCLSCPAFAWERVEAAVAELPDSIDLELDRSYYLTYSATDAMRAVGIERRGPLAGLNDALRDFRHSWGGD